MFNLPVGIALTSVLLMGAFAFSKWFFKCSDQYGDEPTNDLKGKKKRIWNVANYLWIFSTTPLIIGIFASQYSPLKILKIYSPVASIVIFAIGILTIFFKNIRTLLPSLKEPDPNFAKEEYGYSFLKGTLLSIVILTTFFLLIDKDYRQAVKEYYLSKHTKLEIQKDE